MGLLVAGSAPALAPDKQLHQFPRRAWQVEDGLPQNTTILSPEQGLEPARGALGSIREAHDGSLWFATSKGLIRWREGVFSSLPEQGQALRFPLGHPVYEDEHDTLCV